MAYLDENIIKNRRSQSLKCKLQFRTAFQPRPLTYEEMQLEKESKKQKQIVPLDISIDLPLQDGQEMLIGTRIAGVSKTGMSWNSSNGNNRPKTYFDTAMHRQSELQHMRERVRSTGNLRPSTTNFSFNALSSVSTLDRPNTTTTQKDLTMEYLLHKQKIAKRRQEKYLPQIHDSNDNGFNLSINRKSSEGTKSSYDMITEDDDTDDFGDLVNENKLKYPQPEQQIRRYKVRANKGARRRRLKSPTAEFKSLFNQDIDNTNNTNGISVKVKLNEATKTSNNDWIGVGRPRRVITVTNTEDNFPLPSPDQTSWNDGVNIWSPPSTAGQTHFGL
eukprot:g8241.t1